MFRVAIQVKELISSNVTHAIESATNPVKMLNKLQREIEEAIIALEGERTLTAKRKTRLEAELAQNELHEGDWGDKAKSAMEHDREDLARQALLAREDCREAISDIKKDIVKAKTDAREIDLAIKELEAKREDARDRARAQVAADAANAPADTPDTAGSKADDKLSRIAEMEKRADFATEEHAEKRAHSSVDREIEQMRRKSAVDAELEALKGGSETKAPAKRAARKKK